MKLFLRLLIYKLNTIDGSRDSAAPVLETMLKNQVAKFLKSTGKATITASREYLIHQENKFLLFQKIQNRYNVLRVRQKISFSALKKRKTVVELIIGVLWSHFLNL